MTMDHSDKKVDRIPLDALWNVHGILPLRRHRAIGEKQIKILLRESSVQFVFASVGSPLVWVPVEDCYQVWKEEIVNRLVAPIDAERGFRLEDYPDERCYLATEWTGAVPPAILLETYH